MRKRAIEPDKRQIGRNVPALASPQALEVLGQPEPYPDLVTQRECGRRQAHHSQRTGEESKPSAFSAAAHAYDFRSMPSTATTRDVFGPSSSFRAAVFILGQILHRQTFL